MKSVLAAAVFAFGLIAPSAAIAEAPTGVPVQQDVIQQMTPDQVADFLKNQGYRAQVAKDGNDTIVKTALAGYGVWVIFYNCAGKGCGGITFYMGGKFQGIDAAFANDYNLKWRFTKLAVNKEGLAIFTLDVSLKGITTEHLVEDLGHFEYQLSKLGK